MIPPFALQILYKLAGVALVLLALYSGYSHIKSIGYAEAEAKYTLVIKNYEDNLNKKINAIEVVSMALAEESKASSEQLATGINTLISNTRGKTLTVVKNGECLPSETFSKTFREINVRTNQTMKETSK